MSAPRCVCWFCGNPIPAWWAEVAPRPVYDLDADDAAYERWRQTACTHCGKTPAEREPKKPGVR